MRQAGMNCLGLARWKTAFFAPKMGAWLQKVSPVRRECEHARSGTIYCARQTRQMYKRDESRRYGYMPADDGPAKHTLRSGAIYCARQP